LSKDRIEPVATLFRCGSIPLARNASAITDPRRVSGGESAQVSSARSASLIFRRRPHLFLRAGNDKRAVVKQDFRRDVSFNRLADASEDEIDLPLAEFTNLLRDHRNLRDMNGDPLIPPAKPLVHGRKQASDDGAAGPWVGRLSDLTGPALATYRTRRRSRCFRAS